MPPIKPHYVSAYRNYVRSLLKSKPVEEAMALAVGGDFEDTGVLCRDLAVQLGLREGMDVVDVGCGSGRVSYALRQMKIGYLGIDVVPELLSHARRICGRPDWRFEISTDLTIPSKDQSADFVMFLSVLTHLRHEESYLYLKESVRVLRRGGIVLFSFFDFLQPRHWPIFEFHVGNAKSGPTDGVLCQFMDARALYVWAERLGLEVGQINDGDTYPVKLSRDLLIGGHTFSGETIFGQSTCVMIKP